MHRKAEPGSRPATPGAATRRAAALALFLFLLTLLSTPAQAQGEGPGRIVVTITTLEGTVHMPGVQVELRSAILHAARVRHLRDLDEPLALLDRKSVV